MSTSLTNSVTLVNNVKREHQYLTRTLKDYFLGLLVLIIFFGPLLPFLIIFALWKSCIILLCKYLHPDYVELSICDNLIISDINSIKPRMNASQIWRVNGYIDARNFRRHFYNCFFSNAQKRQRHQNLYQYVVKFDEKSVDEFIGEYLTANTYPENTPLWQDEFIGEYLTANTYPENTPLWQVKLVYTDKNGIPLNYAVEEAADDEIDTIVVFKISHAILDGYINLYLADMLANNKSPYIVKTNDTLSFWDKLKIAILASKILASRCIGGFTHKDLFQSNSEIEDKNEKWYYSNVSLDINQLKEIRKLTNTRFFPVCVSLVLGAITKFLKEKDEFVPEMTRVGFSLPWANHPVVTNKPLQNHFAGGLYHFPLKLNDPLTALKEIDADYSFIETSGFPEGFRWLLLAPASLLPRIANLMASSTPYTLMEKEVKELTMPVVPREINDKGALYCVICSNSGRMEISINASTRVVHNSKELDRLTKMYIPQELKRLIEQCRQ